MEQRDAEVLIVGAGPTGLQMAYLLAIQKIPFHIIDKNDGPTHYSKALGVQSRTREMWAALELGAEHLKKVNPLENIVFHQNGERIQQVKFEGLDSAFPYLSIFPQADTENMLIDALEKKEKKVEWNNEFISMEQFGSGVTVEIRANSGTVSKKTYSWVIGCDGAHSPVRHAAKIPFEGHSSGKHFILADIAFDPPLPTDTGMINFTKWGLVALLPISSDKTRIIIEGDPKQELSLQFWEQIIHERAPISCKIEKIEWESKFDVSFVRAKQMISGRVIIAGDAAHIHSPALGQGMNTGLQDVYNLGWKLGLKISNRASGSLMQSYEWERKKTAKELLSLTEAATKMATIKGPFRAMIRKFVLRKFLSKPTIRKQAARRIAQLSINYRGSPICDQELSRDFSKRKWFFAKGPHPGDRAPDAIISLHRKNQIHSLYNYLQHYKHTLLVFARDGAKLGIKTQQNILRVEHKVSTKLCDEMRVALVVKDANHPLIQDWSHDILVDNDYILHKAYHCTRPCIFVIRPDNYIGFRSYKVRSYLLKRYLSRVFDLN